MQALISKAVLSGALASLAFIIPAKTTYVRPAEVYVSIEAQITGYSSEPGQTDSTPFITASGTHVHDGTIACPLRYAFGTIVQIEGKSYTCEDRMNQKFPDRFDIWYASTTEAIDWGTRKLEVAIEQK